MSMREMVPACPIPETKVLRMILAVLLVRHFPIETVIGIAEWRNATKPRLVMVAIVASTHPKNRVMIRCFVPCQP